MRESDGSRTPRLKALRIPLLQYIKRGAWSTEGFGKHSIRYLAAWTKYPFPLRDLAVSKRTSVGGMVQL